jgi:hypothetical protein
MIRNAVIHLNNEQPLLADLFAMPSPADVAVVCTNLRTMNGTRPIFADDSASYFIFPLTFVRFVEMPPASIRESESGVEAGLPAGRQPAAEALPEPDLEIDEDFLRRVRDV